MKKMTLLFLLLASSVYALEFTNVEIKFQVNTNIDAVSFEGKMNIPQLNVEKKKSFQVNPSLFSTDLELRDKHMRESIFSDAQKKIIPILFYVENTNCNNDLENCIIQGKISLNNQEKNIQLNLKGKKKISTGFPIKLSEFKITPPSFMGVTVQDEVVISVNAASK